MSQLTNRQIEAQIDAAIANRSIIDAVEPRANKVIFDNGKIILNFNNGSTFSFLPESVEALSKLPSEVLTTVKLTPSGKGLRWDEPDLDLSIQGLLLGIFGSSIWMKKIAAKDGKFTSISQM